MADYVEDGFAHTVRCWPKTFMLGRNKRSPFELTADDTHSVFLTARAEWPGRTFGFVFDSVLSRIFCRVRR